MTTSSRRCHSDGCSIEVPASFDDGGLCPDHYAQVATHKLETSASHFRDGRGVDSDTLQWLLTQVDFVLQAIGDNSSPLTTEQKSKLLELLLGIVNLNEYIRHAAITAEHTH